MTAPDQFGLPSRPEELSQIRVELAEALRSKGQLQTRLKSAERTRDELRARVKADERLIKQLQGDKAILSVRVRDRDEELRGKTQLLVVILGRTIMACRD